jgi:enediyne biosynthesis protein E4
MNEPPSLLKNLGPPVGNSLLVRLVTPWGSDAIGARVTVVSGGEKQIDEVRSGGSFISQNDFRLHFGLGKANSADLSVRWTDGKNENYPGVAAGQIVTIQEAKGIVAKRRFISARP